MISVTIDGREVSAEPGATLLEAARLAGSEVPTLCHHPELPEGGNCGVCLVEIAGRGSPVLACSERVEAGMEVRTDTEELKRARSDAIGMIIRRHRNDCPSCDKAGSCELADVHFGHSVRRPICAEQSSGADEHRSLGPRVLLRPDRCIACGRCVRFAKDIARAEQIEIDFDAEGPCVANVPFRTFDSAYSLCACDVCPSGALVPNFGGRRAVRWRLDSFESICTGCARGCAVWLDCSSGVPVGLRPRQDRAVNGSWMCDAGREGLSRIFAGERPLSPMIRDGLDMRRTGWDEALSAIGKMFSAESEGEVAVMLSAGASLEENASFLWLAAEVLGCRLVLMSGRGEEASFADSFLRCADRDVNTSGARLMASGGVEALSEGCGVIALGAPGAGDIVSIVEKRPSWAVLVTSEPVGKQRWPDVVLPKTNAYEQDGTYIAHGDVVRRATRCLSPSGQSRTAWDIALWIAEAAGVKRGSELDSGMKGWIGAKVGALVKEVGRG